MRVCEYQREVTKIEAYQVLELEEEDWAAVRFALHCGSLDPALKGPQKVRVREVYEALCTLTNHIPSHWKM